MIKHSIYAACYNLNKMGFPWRETLDNWESFLGPGGQIDIAVNTSEDDTMKTLQDYVMCRPIKCNWIIFPTDIPYSDPLFDGLIKNEALKRCTGEFCTLLDIDEVLPLSNRYAWQMVMAALGQSAYDAVFIPVIDLFHDEHHYKSLGQKWYLHNNRPYLKRDRVSFAARADGTTNIDLSDTCELCRDDGTLARAVGLPGLSAWQDERIATLCANQHPYVIHLGWLSKQQRLRQSAFWAPVWTARDGTKVEQPLTEADLDKTPYYPHSLPHWNAE